MKLISTYFIPTYFILTFVVTALGHKLPGQNYTKKTIQDRRILQEQDDREWLPLRIGHVFTPTALPYLKTLKPVLDAAASFFTKVFLTRREPYPLDYTEYDEGDCLGLSMPDQYFFTKFDYDIVFLIKFLEQKEGVLASAASCVLSRIDSRPVFGVINFGSKVLESASGTLQFEYNIRVTIHEMMHGLGFSDDMMDLYYNSVTGKYHEEAQKMRNNVLYIQTPKVTKFAKNFYSCPTLTGMRMENEGRDGTRGSHWEKRVVHSELMAGTVEKGEFLLTDLTLSFMEDTGWYRVGDFIADRLSFGQQAGCDFLQNGCKNKKYPEFCTKQEFLKKKIGCTYTNVGLGYCKDYGYSDGCYMYHVVGSADCRDPRGNLGPFLMDFGYNSRCFDGYFASEVVKTQLTGSCLKADCSDDYKSILVSYGKNNWTCTKPNQKLKAPASYVGSVSCPSNFTEFCQQFMECPGQCYGKGVCVNRKCYCRAGFTGVACTKACANYDYNNTCVVKCPTGTFVNEAFKKCHGCPRQCSQCDSVGSCNACNQGYMLVDGFCERDWTFNPGNVHLRAQEEDSQDINQTQLMMEQSGSILMGILMIIMLIHS